MIGQDGVEAANVQTLCQAAGIGRTNFYNYFSDIDELRTHIGVQAAAAIRANFDALHKGRKRGLKRLRLCLTMLMELGHKDCELVMLVTSLARSNPATLDVLFNEIKAELTGALTRGQIAGSKRDIRRTASMIAIMCPELMRAFAQRRLDAATAPAVAARIVRLADTEHR